MTEWTPGAAMVPTRPLSWTEGEPCLDPSPAQKPMAGVLVCFKATRQVLRPASVRRRSARSLPGKQRWVRHLAASAWFGCRCPLCRIGTLWIERIILRAVVLEVDRDSARPTRWFQLSQEYCIVMSNTYDFQ